MKCEKCGSDYEASKLVEDPNNFPVFIKYFDYPENDAFRNPPRYLVIKSEEEIPEGVLYEVIATKVEIEKNA